MVTFSDTSQRVLFYVYVLLKKMSLRLARPKVIVRQESINLRWGVTWDNTGFKLQKARILRFGRIIKVLIVHLPSDGTVILGACEVLVQSARVCLSQQEKIIKMAVSS